MSTARFFSLLMLDASSPASFSIALGSHLIHERECCVVVGVYPILISGI
jgi:hypothetical protein